MKELFKFVYLSFDIFLLTAKLIDLGAAFFERDAALRGTAVVDVIKVDHLTCFVEAEADPFSTQQPGEPRLPPPELRRLAPASGSSCWGRHRPHREEGEEGRHGGRDFMAVAPSGHHPAVSPSM